MADALHRSKPEWQQNYLYYKNGVVEELSHLMATKLADNHHKGGWDGLDPMWAFKLLVDEASELIESVIKGEPPEVVALESADCGNYALILWHSYKQKWEKEQCSKEN